MLRTHLLLGLAASLLLPATATACYPITLSLESAGACTGDTSPYTALTLELRATLQADIDAISSISIQALEWPGSPGFPDGAIYAAWYGGAVSGNLDAGLTLSWNPPLVLPFGGELLLGELEVLPMSEGWPGADAPFRVTGSVLDLSSQELPAWEADFTFNCSGTLCDCHPTGAPLDWLLMRNVAPPNGASVLDGFHLSFTVESRDCLLDKPAPFSGRVTVAGGQQFLFGGTGETPFQFVLGTGDALPGEELAVEIAIDGGDISRRAKLIYMVDESVGVGAVNLSSIKTLY